MDFEFEDHEEVYKEHAEMAPDWASERAKAEIKAYFDEHRSAVFFMKQLSVKYEKRFFHWVTGRAV